MAAENNKMKINDIISKILRPSCSVLGLKKCIVQNKETDASDSVEEHFADACSMMIVVNADADRVEVLVKQVLNSVEKVPHSLGIKRMFKMNISESYKKKIKISFIILLFMMSDFPALPQSAVNENMPRSESPSDIKGIKSVEVSETENKKEIKLGKKYALLIGVNEYRSLYLNKLKKARTDAKYMGKILKDLGAFEITVMVDEDSLKNEKLFPTKEKIENEIRKLIEKANEEDTIVIFFSGHGASGKEENGNRENYLLPQDANFPDNRLKENSAVKLSFIIEQIINKKIRKSIVMLDACRNEAFTVKSSGGIASLDDASKEEKFAEAEMGIVYFSTSEGSFSFERSDSESHFGVFTHYLIKALEGSADKDGDGVSFRELAEYVREGIKDFVKDKDDKEKQKPKVMRYLKEEYGDIQLTIRKSPNRSLADIAVKKQYVYRSVLPGLAQYYDERYKTSYAYFTAFGLLAGNLLFSYQGMQKAKKDYNSAIAIPASSITGNTLLYNYMIFGEKRDQYTSAADRLNLGLILFSGFYVWNFFDSYYLSGNLPEVDTLKISEPEKTSLQWDIKSYTSNIMGRSEQNFEMNFFWSF